MKTILLLTFALAFSPCTAFPAGDPHPPMAARTGEPVAFKLRAPEAKVVALRGQWTKDAVPMTRSDDGTWSVTLGTVPDGVWEYSFAVDGLNVMDPLNSAFKPQREP